MVRREGDGDVEGQLGEEGVRSKNGDERTDVEASLRSTVLGISREEWVDLQKCEARSANDPDARRVRTTPNDEKRRRDQPQSKAYLVGNLIVGVSVLGQWKGAG